MPAARSKVRAFSPGRIIADPQAAKEVFEAGLSLYMVPLDATSQVVMNLEDVQPWFQGDRKAGMVAELYEIMFTEYGFKDIDIFDLTAAALATRPGLCDFKPLHLEVDAGGGNRTGQTREVPGKDANIFVCLEPDARMVKQALNERFSKIP